MAVSLIFRGRGGFILLGRGNRDIVIVFASTFFVFFIVRDDGKGQDVLGYRVTDM